MLLKKYPQSCLMVEANDKKILVDPGVLKYEDKYLDEWELADYVLITHKHSDHINKNILKDFTVPIYSSLEVKDAYPEVNMNVIKTGDVIDLDGIKVEVADAVHGYNPNLKNGGEVFENIGYIIGDGKCKLYITGDTLCFKNDYKVDVVALPVTAHGLTMSSFEAALFAKELDAKLVLPIHMDNPTYPTDIEFMKMNFEKYNINYKVLENGESIEI